MGKVEEVTADEAAEGIVNGHFDVVLDVRRPEEYEQTHIPGAVLIPLDKLREDAREKLGDPATPTLVYCAVGGRSLEAVKILSKMGFKNVVNLRGGIRAWEKEGYPVAK
jgi:rhodanese-related sulfurtransferase